MKILLYEGVVTRKLYFGQRRMSCDVHKQLHIINRVLQDQA
ncbi:unnamed protein product [Paramecium pentaurelia]|uniref:Uncharacterized protein n=1 Tax=Paramecium pentaurelia TaxID=43138 RepID=A0A8S1S6Z5_9CILI|nr:unnamed protein product [Paramecium pentaurelia]